MDSLNKKRLTVLKKSLFFISRVRKDLYFQRIRRDRAVLLYRGVFLNSIKLVFCKTGRILEDCAFQEILLFKSLNVLMLPFTLK
jgi:hypothetical protein